VRAPCSRDKLSLI